MKYLTKHICSADMQDPLFSGFSAPLRCTFCTGKGIGSASFNSYYLFQFVLFIKNIERM